MIYTNSIRKIGGIALLLSLATPAKKISIEEIVKQPVIEKINKYETDENINKYLDSIYKNLEIPEIIDGTFVKSIILTESGGYSKAISRVGARGLMQLTKDTWNEVEDLNYYAFSFDPERNIEAGIKYLTWINNYCEKRYPYWEGLSTKEKQDIIATAYNGGITRLKKRDWDISQMPKETRHYVKRISAVGQK